MANQETNVANAYESTLSSALASGDTTINVVSTDGSPGVPFYIVIDPDDDSLREVVLVDSSKTSNTFTLTASSQRGQDGTSDVAHSSNAVVGIYPIAALWTDVNDRIDALPTTSHDHDGTDSAQVPTSNLTGHDKTAHDALALDHGSLTGNADDDHTQYLNTARHDAHDHSTALGTAVSGDLSDVNTTGAATGKALVHNGTGFVIGDHGDLGGVADDDHTQYSRADGTRAFTGTVSGVTPTADAHLATKGYVDGSVTRARAKAASSSAMSTTEQTKATATLTIPASWATYDVDVWASARLFEGTGATGETNVTVKLRVGGTEAGGGWSEDIDATEADNAEVVGVVGYLEGQSTTGSVDVTFTTQLSSEDGAFNVAFIVLTAYAWRTS